MLKIEFGFGIEFDRNNHSLPASEMNRGISEINKKAMSLFGGFTMFQTYGGWVDPETDADVREVGRCLVVYMSVNANTQGQIGESIDHMVACIKKVLHQKAVAVCLTDVTSEIL